MIKEEVTEEVKEEVTEEVTEEVKEEVTLQVSETREQLRSRLKEKIKGKRNIRTNGITKKHSDNLNDSIKKVADILAEDKIKSADQINDVLLEKIMSTITKKDLEIILQHMQNNSQFKEILLSLKDKMNN